MGKKKPFFVDTLSNRWAFAWRGPLQIISNRFNLTKVISPDKSTHKCHSRKKSGHKGAFCFRRLFFSNEEVSLTYHVQTIQTVKLSVNTRRMVNVWLSVIVCSVYCVGVVCILVCLRQLPTTLNMCCVFCQRRKSSCKEPLELHSSNNAPFVALLFLVFSLTWEKKKSRTT